MTSDTKSSKSKADVEKELDEHMKKPEVIAEIEKISVKTGIAYGTCEFMYRSTARGFIENKEFWSKFRVVD